MRTLPVVISFFLFALVLALVPAALKFAGYGNLLVVRFWLMYSFITGLTLLAIIALLVTQRVNPEKFAQTFLAVTVFKILACLGFMVVFILKNKADKTAFAVDFFYLYFLNTAFEVYVLLRNLRNQNLK